MSLLFWKKKPTTMRWCELGGGLGDAVTVMFTSSRYNDLERLEPREQATVVLMSHNPHVHELFKWHPKRQQLIVRDLGFWWPKDDAERRVHHHLPPAQPFVFKLQEKCMFYHSPEDLEIIKGINKPFVVIGAAAGGIDRNVPSELCELFADQATRRGFQVVVIGRTYGNDRTEIRLRPRDHVIDLVDKLTVPGAALLLERATAVLAAHSSMCLLSWYLKKPVLLLYPQHVRDNHFHSVHQYTFGKDYETTRHMLFSECSSTRIEEFLSSAVHP